MNLQEPSRPPRDLPFVGVRRSLLGDVGRLRTAVGRRDAAADPRHDEEEDRGGQGGGRAGENCHLHVKFIDFRGLLHVTFALDRGRMATKKQTKGREGA